MKTVAFTCSLEYRARCAFCENRMMQTFQIHSGGEIPRPSLPPGWREINGQVVCRYHEAQLVIDGSIRQEL